MVGLEASYDAHHYLDVIFSWDVAEELASDVEEIISTPAGYSFAALKADGSVVVWGKSEGSDIEAMETQLSGGVSAVFTTGGVGSYAALKEDGSAVTWGLYIKQSSSSSGDVYMLGSNISNIFPLPSGFVVTKAPRCAQVH